ncbi:hypothetical protein HO173_002406 [Letharia columbiana]|uniref:Uncharacterized protein n=1 Tax=Letharia columbiana TaxID=112416 RepID=A0A8H6L8X6_9LECA|nr:uncharacterized protein HO173_002406 [Letharia columbiana]KAF6239859.1 hypothetical protein HO173_002406 [Letharia columbiana]
MDRAIPTGSIFIVTGQIKKPDRPVTGTTKHDVSLNTRAPCGILDVLKQYLSQSTKMRFLGRRSWTTTTTPPVQEATSQIAPD